MRHMFDVDFKNIVHQFKANLSDEVESTMTVFGFEYRFNLHINRQKRFQRIAWSNDVRFSRMRLDSDV